MRYAVVIERAGENYSAYVPDLPGCVAIGDSLAEAKSQIARAMKQHLDGLKEDGHQAPEPASVVAYIDA